ncbi:hypothetical protein GW17_00027433 [Ensete ventricosum]|nr:hypothetical protein GW17_00027433 [Ensete ventricosum]
MAFASASGATFLFSTTSAAMSTTSPAAAVTKPFISMRRSSYHFWELLSISLGSPSFSSSAISHRRTFIALRRLCRVPSRCHHPLFSATLAPALVPISGPAIDLATLSPVVSSPLHQVAVDRFQQNRVPITLFPLFFSFLSLVAGNAEADSVVDALHSAADLFCNRSSLSSTILSPQPRATLPDLLEGVISCFLPRHRSASSLDTDLLEGAVSCFLPQHRPTITLRPSQIA